MQRSIDGRIVIGASRCRAEKRPEYQAKEQSLAEMTARKLKAQLCSIAGLKSCGKCRLCEYGKEYLRRAEAQGKPIQATEKR